MITDIYNLDSTHEIARLMNDKMDEEWLLITTRPKSYINPCQKIISIEKINPLCFKHQYKWYRIRLEWILEEINQTL